MIEEEDSNDSEKRFLSVINKLFNTPKPNPSSRNQSSKGKKRGSAALSESSNELRGSSGLSRSLVPAESFYSSPAMCRPWDRGDFFKRLATFKSMTWFGKPKVVSAINCAKRGWINVEMDIIACEACGARLLFSSPSSWKQQQIEKAAAVFSLKLDNGHKLLCPWIDNASDESIAQFPPTAAPALVDSYRKRSAALLQLSSLPKISSSAIGYMACAQLQYFLEKPSVQFGIEFSDGRTEDLDPERATSAKLYYQAQKLISLCGWEPRSLPYAVDCKDRSTKARNGHSEEMSQCLVNVQKPGVMYLTSGVKDATDVEEDPSFNFLQSDSACTVLDCKLCGASAGLWAFSTVPRPLELFRIDESLEVSGQTSSVNFDADVIRCIPGTPTDELSDKDNHTSSNGITIRTTSTKELLNSSIAGGPPPAKQNYIATVSLPIITRHLGVVLSIPDAKSPLMSNSVQSGDEMIHCDIVDSQDNDHVTPSKPILQSKDMETFVQNKNGNGVAMFSGSNTSHLNGVAIFSGNNTSHLNGDPCKSDNNDKNTAEGSVSLTQSPSRSGEYVRNTENAAMGIEINSRGEELNAIVPHVIDSVYPQSCNELSKVSVHQLDEVPSETNMVITESLEGSNKMQHIVGSEKAAERTAAPELVKHLERVQPDHTLEFDPIKQHRHFCPWILSTGKAGPGWQQTLNALTRDKSSPRPPLTDSASSSKFEDDPIISIRNLFQSPSAKRLKTSRI